MSTTQAAQAIRNAIEAELAASRFYRLLAASTVDDEARAFLEEMSQAELEHAEAIDKHRLKLVQDPLPSTVDSKVEVIETVPNWKYVDDISFDEALEVAKTAEIQACMYYDAIADNLAGELQEFFRELSRTEQQHARLIDERRSLLGS